MLRKDFFKFILPVTRLTAIHKKSAEYRQVSVTRSFGLVSFISGIIGESRKNRQSIIKGAYRATVLNIS
jgi:hypothetical protein